MTEHISQLVNRRKTMVMLDYSNPVSLRRLELAGKLTPIKLNPRRVCYDLAQVQGLMTKGVLCKQ